MIFATAARQSLEICADKEHAQQVTSASVVVVIGSTPPVITGQKFLCNYLHKLQNEL